MSDSAGLCEQLLAGIGPRHAARGACQQPHADLFLEPTNRMTQP
jgi:hypothetical protein